MAFPQSDMQLLFSITIDAAQVTNDCLHYGHSSVCIPTEATQLFLHEVWRRKHLSPSLQRGDVGVSIHLEQDSPRNNTSDLDVPTKNLSWTKHHTTALHLLTGGGFSPNSDWSLSQSCQNGTVVAKERGQVPKSPHFPSLYNK